MTDPINLTQLRNRADTIGYGDVVTRDELLALIDIAEAAHDYARTSTISREDWPKFKWLRDALTRINFETHP